MHHLAKPQRSLLCAWFAHNGPAGLGPSENMSGGQIPTHCNGNLLVICHNKTIKSHRHMIIYCCPCVEVFCNGPCDAAPHYKSPSLWFNNVSGVCSAMPGLYRAGPRWSDRTVYRCNPNGPVSDPGDAGKWRGNRRTYGSDQRQHYHELIVT